MTGYVITDDGMAALPRVFSGEADPFTYVALGTGVTDPERTDHALEVEALRKPATISFDGSTALLEVTVAAGEIEADITEMGPVNASEGGTLYSREVRAPVSVGPTQGAIFRVKVPFARSDA